MSKNNRGKALWKTPSRSRGTCPSCHRTRIKLLYNTALDKGDSIKVCKRCSGTSK